MTDYYIAHQVIQLATSRQPTQEEISHFIARYEEILPYHLTIRQGHLTPSVKEILTYIQSKPDYVSLLLTGNTAIGAKIKLTHYGLDPFFDFTASAFCNDSFNRTDISALALSIVQKQYPTVAPDQIYIIGDTPNDIHCGKAIGARTVAVATGRYSLDELNVHNPWWSVATLPAPMEFIKNINR